MEALAAGGDFLMIGQFGVGFYSAHFVADEVQVFTLHFDDEQYIEESAAGASFAVLSDTELVRREVKRGSKVICCLDVDQAEFREERTLKSLGSESYVSRH